MVGGRDNRKEKAPTIKKVGAFVLMEFILCILDPLYDAPPRDVLQYTAL